jgi:hypothetical protein
MRKNSLPEHLRRQMAGLNIAALPDRKGLKELFKRITPEQRRMLNCMISNTMAKIRRSQFKLVVGGKRRQT